MITNPWINRIGALVLLIAVYTAGRVDGRDQAAAALRAHPVCHTELHP